MQLPFSQQHNKQTNKQKVIRIFLRNSWKGEKGQCACIQSPCFDKSVSQKLPS